MSSKIAGAQQLLGYVMSTQMPNMVKVRVPKVVHLEKYGVDRVRHGSYHAYDSTGKCLVGDQVRIVRVPRITKSCAFAVADIVKSADRFVDERTGFVYTNGTLNIPVGVKDPTTGQIRNTFTNEEYKKMGII
ncbi:hypothetical protein MP228_008112 [Amoeboaphelidium protococcarum]|nr:hypothetical protein MP228_008112 [Amoeboaphelidium protococcarum]